MDQKIILFQGDSITDAGRDKENATHSVHLSRKSRH